MKHWFTALLYLNLKDDKTGSFQISSLTSLLLFSSVVLFVTKLTVFVFFTCSLSEGLALWLAHLSQVFSFQKVKFCSLWRAFAGAVRGVSLVINIDEFAVRRGRRQVPFQ